MSETIIRLGEREVDIAQAFPLDLGFIEDAIDAGINLMEADQGLDPASGLKLIKMILKRCDVPDEEARKLPMADLPRITKIVEERMTAESDARPT